MSEKLIECPFCGSEAEHISKPNVEIIQCTLCDMGRAYEGSGDALIAMWNTRHEPTHETVEQWEERTGETYPDDGPVWVWTVNNPSCRKKWVLMSYSLSVVYDNTCKITIANHHGKPS